MEPESSVQRERERRRTAAVHLDLRPGGFTDLDAPTTHPLRQQGGERQRAESGGALRFALSELPASRARSRSRCSLEVAAHFYIASITTDNTTTDNRQHEARRPTHTCTHEHENKLTNKQKKLGS
jgi:hypothetical protein